jgi:hypothetical protein
VEGWWKQYRARLNAWGSSRDVLFGAFLLSATVILALVGKWSLAVLITGLILVLGLIVLPPIWVGVSPEAGVVRRADRIRLVAALRLRWSTYLSAASSGALIGLVSELGRTELASAGIAAVGVAACGLSYAAGRRSRV